MAALTTSQSATTKSIVPIGIAIGMPAQFMIAMWPSLIGVLFLPANGTQLAAISADRTGSTKIGSFVINHSFQPNNIIMWLVTIALGMILAVAIYGTAADAAEPSPEAPPAATVTEAPAPTETPPPEVTPTVAETPPAEEPTATVPAEEPTATIEGAATATPGP
jgi:hypothetical protein